LPEEIFCALHVCALTRGVHGAAGCTVMLQISEFLLALLEDAHAMRWCSFCK
jgi:hypothetical protein